MRKEQMNYTQMSIIMKLMLAAANIDIKDNQDSSDELSENTNDQ